MLQPKSIRNRTGLAVAYAASVGQFDTADREFQEALKLEPQNPALLADIEYVSRLRIRYSRELEAADIEIRLHSGDAPAHERASFLSLRLGRTDRAIAEARDAIRIAPETWRPHYALAMALFAGGDYAGSSAALADAKKRGSGDRPFLEDSLRTATSSSPAK
jgi:Flp pilus assembly protein TadD